MSSRTSPTILCANHWHDDNRGDSAISEATVTLLRERWPASNIRIVTLNEPISIGAGTVGRHLTMAHPNVLVEPSLVPTENGSWAGTDSAGTPRSRIMIAMRGGVWLLRLLPFALGFLVGRVPPRVAKRLAGVDMMVLLGGSDIYDNPSVLQVLSLARLFTVLYPLWAASELGIPVVVLGHTIGPLSRPIGRRLTTRLLGLAQSVVVRESTSLALVKALGLRNA
ncbi:MAG TPA: polysaccharide pyruvyl transferase family protein, partial [Candidatus Dormibacteraeota bacterium]|nr:polysaccharide pyruvyl transferase family protein [Candidatus Dormibacteraeota bacterium]